MTKYYINIELLDIIDMQVKRYFFFHNFLTHTASLVLNLHHYGWYHKKCSKDDFWTCWLANFKIEKSKQYGQVRSQRKSNSCQNVVHTNKTIRFTREKGFGCGTLLLSCQYHVIAKKTMARAQ